MAGSFSFQSAPPHGRRQELRWYEPDEMFVSIRASAREATWDLGGTPTMTKVSIRASAREATSRWPGIDRGLVLFQSAPPHGRRPATRLYPHLHREFQSAPPHGRRRSTVRCVADGCRFQSAPPHGRRHSIFLCPDGRARFQSAPPHGRRLGDRFEVEDANGFQSAPPHGRRPRQPCHADELEFVSIRASAREATIAA